MSLPVLIILHQENSTPGRVGQYLRRRGVPLDIRRPSLGDPLPDTLDQATGGGGRQLFFAWPEGREVRNRANLRPGIDVRGAGGGFGTSPRRVSAFPRRGRRTEYAA